VQGGPEAYTHGVEDCRRARSHDQFVLGRQDFTSRDYIRQATQLPHVHRDSKVAEKASHGGAARRGANSDLMHAFRAQHVRLLGFTANEANPAVVSFDVINQEKA